MVGSIVCTTLEVALGITAASIASMRPLLKKFDIILTLKSLRQRSQHSHRSKEKGSISLGSLSTSATQNQKPYLREEVSMTEVPLTWQGPAHCPRRCDLYDERGTV